MILGSLLIGLLTAYYFGVKPGIIAGAGAALLFIAADVIPGAQLGVYVLVAMFIIAVCVVGPRRADSHEDESKNAIRRWSKRAMSELWRRM